ncbi:MAG: hypothetical protein J5922_04780 [Clostridia bacterium]|nr:hypothetical protein [Clostridia bacterium]
MDVNNNKDLLEIDIKKLVMAFWHKIWFIVLASGLCAALAFSYAAFIVTPQYSASSLMFVNNSSISLGATSISMTSSDLSASKTLVDTYIVILKTRKTLNKVIEETGVKYSYGRLSNMISVSAVNNTSVFKITVTSPHPEESALIANSISDVLIDSISDIIEGTSARIVDRAVVPTSRSSPNVTRYTAIGLLAGLVIAVAIIVISELNDDLVHNGDLIVEKYKLPVFAEIPDLNAAAKRYGYYQKYGKYKKYSSYSSYGSNGDYSNAKKSN